jgi:hypothetical protein
MTKKSSKADKKTKEVSRIVNDVKCLMIKYGGRKYFTEEKNYPMLIEFGKKFSAEISVVKVSQAEMLIDMKTLAECICNPDYKPSTPEVNVEVLESRLGNKTVVSDNKGSEKQETKSSSMEEEMEQTLKSGKKFVISDWYYKWSKEEDGDYSKIYNRFIKVKNDIIKAGYIVKRQGRGTYVAHKST